MAPSEEDSSQAITIHLKHHLFVSMNCEVSDELRCSCSHCRQVLEGLVPPKLLTYCSGLCQHSPALPPAQSMIQGQVDKRLGSPAPASYMVFQ